ncbi:hypothetical protein K504DRAFT_395814 [Pleomassaria siparia CBS 279.74]|uniref:Uncharacterized protein n=1 Tax=Pleomassaria siparia CBS 279.74 TaxID=1314801 RepID=A0A6G1KQR2_9PLEO|nr:hypothetical protein K504DRAFT_395814 [Pleomassaria siparia CBS 279.74]
MATKSQLDTTPLPLKTVITIDGTEYSIDASPIPYLASFVDFESKARPDATTLVHGPIPLFPVALKGVESGYRHCFRGIPADISQYHILCETYQFLGVDVLDGQGLDEISANLKAGKPNYELEYASYEEIRGDKSKARNAAFKLLYLMLLGEFRDEKRDAAKVFNAVLFVVSHSATFKRGTRTSVQLAYEDRFVITEKQAAMLNKWADKSNKENSHMEDDSTTEEEDSTGFSSDGYDYDWDLD